MASSDLSTIPLGAAPSPGDRLYTVQGGNSRGITVDQVRAFGDKLDAVVAPTINDDSASGFRVGSVWVDVTVDRSYRCVDASVGAAIWFEESGPLKNFAATVAPTINDDAATGGFAVGSVWVDVAADRSYRCVDASTGAAVWLLETVAPDVLVVRTLVDLPAAVGNVITLPSNSFVLIEGSIVLGVGDFIDVPAGTVLRGRSRELDEIVGDTATQVVRYQSRGANVANLAITQNGAGNTIELNVAAFHFVTECQIAGGPIHCTLGDGLLLVDSLLNGNGLLIDSAFVGGLLIDECVFATLLAGDVCIDFAVGGSVGQVTISRARLDAVASAFGIRMNNQNQASDGLVFRSRFVGAGTFLSGVAKTSANWQFLDAIGVDDSNDNGISRAAPGAVAPGTVALTLNTWTPISDAGVNITYALGTPSERFSLNDVNTGELIHDGPLTRTFFVQALITAENNGSGQYVVEIGIDKNGSGTPDADSIHLFEIEPTRFQQFLMPLFPVELAPADRVVALIRNVTNSQDADVAISTLTVTS